MILCDPQKAQLAKTCPKLATKTLENGVYLVQSYIKIPGRRL